MKVKNIQHFSRFTDKGPSIAERVDRTTRSFLKKTVFEKGNADWLSELSSVTKKYKNTIHHSIKMTPVQASKESNDKAVIDKLKDNREIQKPKFNLGQLVRTADIKRVFSKGDSTNWSSKIHTKTEKIHDTIPSFRINYFPQDIMKTYCYQQKQSLDENNQRMQEINLIQ